MIKIAFGALSLTFNDLSDAFINKGFERIGDYPQAKYRLSDNGR